jgi:hypothetical protein
MKTAAPIRFAGFQLSTTRHVRAFINRDEETHVLLSCIARTLV